MEKQFTYTSQYYKIMSENIIKDRNMNKRRIIMLALVIILGTAGYFLPYGNLGKYEKIYIHVTGAVKDVGIFALSAGDTVQDAIDAAGGALQKADLSTIDIYRKLTYAQPLDIPFQ